MKPSLILNSNGLPSYFEQLCQPNHTMMEHWDGEGRMITQQMSAQLPMLDERYISGDEKRWSQEMVKKTSLMGCRGRLMNKKRSSLKLVDFFLQYHFSSIIWLLTTIPPSSPQTPTSPPPNSPPLTSPTPTSPRPIFAPWPSVVSL